MCVCVFECECWVRIYYMEVQSCQKGEKNRKSSNLSMVQQERTGGYLSWRPLQAHLDRQKALPQSIHTPYIEVGHQLSKGSIVPQANKHRAFPSPKPSNSAPLLYPTVQAKPIKPLTARFTQHQAGNIPPDLLTSHSFTVSRNQERESTLLSCLGC